MIPPALLLDAYRSGWFPMAVDHTAQIHWFSPDPRGVIPLDAFRRPKRLERTVRSGQFDVRVDSAFGRVIRECAERDDTWISAEIIASYEQLHVLGFAHSVETWQQDELTGGLYGIALRGAFFGESMFHRATDASKVALVALVERLRHRGYTLLDVQWVTPHLARFGAVEIPRDDYLQLLDRALLRDCRFP